MTAPLTPEEVWRIYDATEARLTAPLSLRMLDLAGIGPGKRVLDLATGRGEPAILAAQRVGPSGRVLGIDVSPTMLAMANERAAREGLTNLELRVMNAELLEGVPTASFDSVLVRWGLMYMDAPLAALKAARRALVPSGAFVAAVWAEPERVPYFSLPRRVLQRHRALAPGDFASAAMFAYADPKRLRVDLEQAGFRLEHTEELETQVMEAKTDTELIAWMRAFGLTRLLNPLPEPIQRAWEEEFLEAAEAYREGDFIRLGGVTRLVVASALGAQPFGVG